MYHSELTYRAKPFYDYAFIARGITKFDGHTTVESDGETRFDRFTYREIDNTYIIKNMPAFRDEEFMPNRNDYVPNINFQLSAHTSWRNGTNMPS